ncbi:MAG: transporter substrate-binding domain-containing protein [Rhodobacteraceae bacterium]|nr:transporter substrate-binding domain-containing protein [Paracoccaceae bacterium]MCP5342462.1 transporter substrate-binding domain-containing protein [Paracoccaceae bacterium]
MNFKTTIAAAIAALTVTAGIAMAEPVKVGVAAEPYPPFSSLDASGKWVGWEIDIMNAICAAESMDCVLTPVAWDGIIPSLTGKQIDAIMSSMSITEERSKTIDFSDKYYNTPADIVAAKSSDITPSPEGLKGKIIGVQASTIHQAYAQKYFTDAAEIRVYQTQDEINQDLAAGRIDATLADSIALSDFVASDAGACCEDKGPVMDDPTILGMGVGVGVRKGDDALREKFNAGIKAIRENGEYDAITKKYFKSDIYGS